MSIPNLFESPQFRAAIGPVTGQAIRPGGISLTMEAAGRCCLPENARVLDIGCGAGATAACLRSKFKFNAIGIDRSALLLADALKQEQMLPLIRGDAVHLPFAGSCMDGVFMECVMSLIPEPSNAASECCRVLKPGAWLIISDIYARNKPANIKQEPFPMRSCLGGAMNREKIEDMINNSGFHCLAWEDRSDLLKQMAAQLVFEFGSMNAFWSAFCNGNTQYEFKERIKDIRPGYYLLMARKK